MFNGEVVTLQTDCPTGEHVGRILHLVQVRESLVVGATRKMPTPKIRAPMGKSPDNSKALFRCRAVVALRIREAFAIIRDDIQLLIIGATLGRLG